MGGHECETAMKVVRFEALMRVCNMGVAMI